MIDELRSISSLLTRAANAPMQDAVYALSEARRQFMTLLMKEEKKTARQAMHGQRVEARQ